MKHLFTVLLFLSLSGCAVKVSSSYDETIDFNKYQTFCWLDGCEFTYTGPSYLDDSTTREYLKSAIIEELSRKGLQQNTEDPDLLIDFHVSIEDKTTVIYHQDDENEYVYRIDEGPIEYINFLKGTLIIDMVDRAESRMVWRSAAIRYMDLNPQLTKKNIQKGIASALKDFPPESPE